MVIDGVESGAINVMDTGVAAGDQRAQRATGRALADLTKARGYKREELFVSAQIGTVVGDEAEGVDRDEFQALLAEVGIVEPEGDVIEYSCLTPSFLDEQLDQALRNLQLDCLDLVLLDNPAEAQLPIIGSQALLERLKDAFAFLETQREAQRIKFYGISSNIALRLPPSHPLHLSLGDLVTAAWEVAGPLHGFRFIRVPLDLDAPEACTATSQYAWAGADADADVSDEDTEAEGHADRLEPLSVLDAAERFGVGVLSVVTTDDSVIPSHRSMASLALPAQRALQFARSVPHAALVTALVPVYAGCDHYAADVLAVGARPPLTADQFIDLCLAL